MHSEPDSAWSQRDPSGDIVRRLREAIEDHHRLCARRAGWQRRYIPTGLRALDAALPRGGLPLGAITEIASDGAGVGAMSLAMRIAVHCGWSMNGGLSTDTGASMGDTTSAGVSTGDTMVGGLSMAGATSDGLSMSGTMSGGWSMGDGLSKSGDPPKKTPPPASNLGQPSTIDSPWIVFVDTHGDLYPPALAPFGLSLERLIVVRPRCEKDALWAVNQALRCSAVAVVIAPLRRLDERTSRRLQLAAESSGVLGLILRPARDRAKTFSAVRLLIEAVGAAGLAGSPGKPRAKPGGGFSIDAVRLCRITLLKVREGRPAEPILVDLHHETGDGPVSSVPCDRSMATG